MKLVYIDPDAGLARRVFMGLAGKWHVVVEGLLEGENETACGYRVYDGYNVDGYTYSEAPDNSAPMCEACMEYATREALR